MHKSMKEDLAGIVENSLSPTKTLSLNNLTSQSSKVATICASAEVVSTALGFPGVGTAIGSIIGLLMP